MEPNRSWSNRSSDYPTAVKDDETLAQRMMGRIFRWEVGRPPLQEGSTDPDWLHQ